MNFKRGCFKSLIGTRIKRETRIYTEYKKVITIFTAEYGGLDGNRLK
jgi:hypothetical protein